MKLKSFVLALGLVLVSTCIYAQNKGKNITKAVEVAITGKAPGAAARASKVSKAPTAAKAPVTPRVPAAKAAPIAPKNSAAKLPPSVSAAKLAEGMAPQKAKIIAFYPTGRIFKQGYHTNWPHEVAEEALSARRGKEILEDTLDMYLPNTNDVNEILNKNIMRIYETFAPTKYWQIIGFVNRLLEDGPKKGIDISPAKTPEMHSLLSAMTLREYIIKHGASFPKYGDDPLLDIIIMDIWHWTVADRLPPNAAAILYESFWASSTRTMADILQDTNAYAQKYGHLPGFDVLVNPQTAVAHRTAGGAAALTEEQKQAIALGTELLFAVKITSSAIRDFDIPEDTETQEILNAWSNVIDQETAKMMQTATQP